MNTATRNTEAPTEIGTKTEIRYPIPGVDPSAPYVLQRNEGDHRHFLNHLATRKVAAGDNGAVTAVEFVQPKGFGPPLHCHDDEDEIVVVLEGEIAFRSGDTESVGRAGSIAYLPHGVPHSFQVLSDEARMIAITATVNGAKPRFDQMVAALGTPSDTPTQPQPVEINPGEVAEVNARYGITILGPPPAPLPD